MTQSDISGNLEDSFINDYQQHTHLPTSNPHVSILLNCPILPNSRTNHARLPVRIYRISLTAPTTSHDATNKHFNPTFLRLPHFSRESTYLLVSRLVTTGLHQESHVCLASLCQQITNPGTFLPPGIRPCTPTDIDLLGPSGGLRCDSVPIRVNIPPTPANQCYGAWTTFPDIPGFHDPRIFWSGKGEPLIIVNSASAYGCVGLWVVDLRTLVPELDDLMSKTGKYAGNPDDDTGASERIMPKRTSYPHLTEITRNPRSSRNDIEKNWIMFFPEGDETWVMYGLVGHSKRTNNQEQGDGMFPRATLSAVEGLSTTDKSSVLPKRGSVVDNQNTTIKQSSSGNVSGTRANSSQLLSHHDTQEPFLGGRTLAQLIGNGFTTPNLTSAEEPPCLHPLSAYMFDSLGKEGHWHQGSNSLRLILCRRNEQQHLHDIGESSERAQICPRTQNEKAMIDSGMVIHFAVLHRKFSNQIDLPMRYERYFVLWEARRPFRVLGVSRYPILMQDEIARPWTEEENWPTEDGSMDDKKASKNDEHSKRNFGSSGNRKHSSSYFTYTPSLTWAWQPKADTAQGDSSGDSEENASFDLGTGYLDDEVLVGIGIDDVDQGFATVKADMLLSCLRLCPGFEQGNNASQKGNGT